MNILLLGSGGREHAMAWKISQSKLCSHLYIAPGNPGTAKCGENVVIGVNDFAALANFCKRSYCFNHVSWSKNFQVWNAS
jgi:phosphoribosylamine--glycine ligase